MESLPVDPALLDKANWWFDVSWYGLLWAGAATALAACATVIFLFVQFWSSGVRERHAEWRTSSLELQTETAKTETARLGAEAEKTREGIAKANAAGEAAKAEAARANAEIATAKQQTAALEKDTSKANERAAALENEAAQARLEQERLKAAVSWRTLSPDTLARLTAGLGDPKGSVVLAYTSGDPEALFLAIQISKTFEAAHGWTLGADARTYPDRILWGLYIPGNGTLVEHVRAAFTAAKIPFLTDAIPEPPMRFGPPMTPDTVLIFVGSKQPPI
ncbi:MAG TPA: hypothetical protein VMV19_01895 [Xanthobacteraceae bacterium]|nr:hypothetical protein [Xanthobacteraceae bacterium]